MEDTFRTKLIEDELKIQSSPDEDRRGYLIGHGQDFGKKYAEDLRADNRGKAHFSEFLEIVAEIKKQFFALHPCPVQAPKKRGKKRQTTSFKPRHQKEEWYPIADFPDYVISSYARVARAIAGPRSKAGHVLKPKLKYPRPEGRKKDHAKAKANLQIVYRLYRTEEGRTVPRDRTAAELLMNATRRRPSYRPTRHENKGLNTIVSVDRSQLVN